jgi:putative phosphoesterase
MSAGRSDRGVRLKAAVISDIHGNLTALRAVDEAVRKESPDLVVVGGDLVGNGGRLAEVIDLIRERGWPCIAGNTDEMLWQPERIDALAQRMPQMARLWDALRADIRLAIESIGFERLEWLRKLPDRWSNDAIAVVHASPGDKWSSPASKDAPDDELTRVYGPLGRPIAVFGHLHVPFVRRLGSFAVANSGSVGMPHDGDPRASWLLIEGNDISVRRVEYDIDAEVADRRASGYPNPEWISRILRSASFSPP